MIFEVNLRAKSAGILKLIENVCDVCCLAVDSVSPKQPIVVIGTKEGIEMFDLETLSSVYSKEVHLCRF